MILAGIGMAGSQQIILEPVVQCFTSNTTWACCPGTVCIEVVAIGAGGKGGNAGGNPTDRTVGSVGGAGGGAGGVSACVFTSGFGTSQCVIVGSGNSCFGSLLIARQGTTGANGFTNSAGSNSIPPSPGGTGNVANGGTGGGASFDAGSITTTASPGTTFGGGGAGNGAVSVNFSIAYQSPASGAAGTTTCGLTRGAGGNGGNQTTGSVGTSFGGGGGGGGVPSGAGAAGAPGIIQVTQFFA